MDAAVTLRISPVRFTMQVFDIKNWCDAIIEISTPPSYDALLDEWLLATVQAILHVLAAAKPTGWN